MADLHTKVSGACPPPTGPNSFVFTYVFTEKCLCQRLAPPPMRVGTPPMGNPGSAPALLAPWLQHVGKHFLLPLLTPCAVYSLWQSPHQCRVCIGLYTLSSRRGFHIGYCIAKGVSERCIARLFLTQV